MNNDKSNLNNINIIKHKKEDYKIYKNNLINKWITATFSIVDEITEQLSLQSVNSAYNFFTSSGLKERFIGLAKKSTHCSAIL